MSRPSEPKRFRVRYTDEDDDCCPIFAYTTTADSREHAERKFYEGPDPEGWKIVSIERIRPT
jgi:hypothetical protein